jgi:hypothetical protein
MILIELELLNKKFDDSTRIITTSQIILLKFRDWFLKQVRK